MDNSDDADADENHEAREDLPGASSPLSLSLGSSLGQSQDFRRQLKPPSKKKYEEDMEELLKQIRVKEAELKSLGIRPAEVVAADLRSIRAEKDAAIGKRKKIDSDLKLLNLEMTKKMGLLSRTESNLHYKSEAKIDDAIRKMEWQLKVQNFKLPEERRVVAEVDKLKRSKKVLTQYFGQKKEVDEMRDGQRRMRGEREYYYRAVTNLKNREDVLKKSSAVANDKGVEVRNEINVLYERKRKLQSDHKKQETDYQRMKTEHKVMQRKESFRRREEDRIAKEKALRKEQMDYVAHKEPFGDEKNLCNTLMSYLQRYINTELPSPRDEMLPSPRDEQPETSIGQAPGVADSLDDGMFVRLKKSVDTDMDYTIANRRVSKRNRKGRKLSVTKPLAHTPQIISQFSSLTLNAPSTVSEIAASLEQLTARKRYYDEHSADVSRPFLGGLSGSFSSSGSLSSLDSPLRERSSTWGYVVEIPPVILENQTPSDAGISSESGFHDMSRQASKTESSESAADVHPSDLVLEELIKQSSECAESEHSRSSSETITPEETAADDAEVKVVVDHTGDPGQPQVTEGTTIPVRENKISQRSGSADVDSSGPHDNYPSCIVEESGSKTDNLLRGHNRSGTGSAETADTDLPHIGGDLTYPKIVITGDKDYCDVDVDKKHQLSDHIAEAEVDKRSSLSDHSSVQELKHIPNSDDNKDSTENITITNPTDEDILTLHNSAICATDSKNVQGRVREPNPACNSVNMVPCDSGVDLMCDSIPVCDTDSAVCSQSDSEPGNSDNEVDHVCRTSAGGGTEADLETQMAVAVCRDPETTENS